MGERDHYLHGAEEVRSAANTMRAAADTMSSAASSMQDAADRIARANEEQQVFLNQWLERFRTDLRCEACKSDD